MNRIDTVFAGLRQQNRKAFMPFIAAGDPSLDGTALILRTLQDRRAADLV